MGEKVTVNMPLLPRLPKPTNVGVTTTATVTGNK